MSAAQAFAPAFDPPGDAQTMVYTVDLGDGRIADVEGPKGATPEQLQAFMAQQQPQQPLPLDNRSTEYQGGFPDELPAQAASRLAPEDEARVIDLLRNRKYDEAASFAASKNHPIGNMAELREGIEKTGAVNPDAVYELPHVADEGAGVAGVRGVADTLTLGALQKLGAVADATGAAIGGGDWSDAYDRSLDKNNATIASDEENHPWARVAGQLAGGLMLPAGLEGVASRAEAAALNAGKSMREAHTAGLLAVRNRMAAVGGAYGAAHGAGSADSLGDAATGALIEGGLGLATGGLLGQAGKLRKVDEAVATGTADAQNVMQAFKRGDVQPLGADVGGTFSKMATGAANMTLGGIPLSQVAQKTVYQTRAFRSRIAENIGRPFRDIEGRSDSYGAGLAAQRGAKEVLGEGGVKATRGEALYSAIPINPQADASVANTRAALADVNAGLESNEQLSKLISDPRLQAYQRAFQGEKAEVPTGILDAAGKPITRTIEQGGKIGWQDLQRFRSYVGELAGRPTLQSDTSQKALKRLYAGLSEDMRATAAGNNALPQFTRANNYHRALEARREQVLGQLLGNNLDASGADAFRAIERWSTQGGDVFSLGRTLRSLPDDVAANVRATIFDRLGNVSKGRNDGTGLVFSPNDFITHWNGLSGRAKAVLFPGAQYRQSIDDLVRIAASQKGAQAYANVSKTGNAVNGIALLSGFFTNPLATLPIAVGQIAFGKFIASARFAKWAAGAPKKPNPAAALAHIQRLTAIARAEPAIANEVLHLQQRLADAFTLAPTRIAAQEPGNGVAEGQRDQGGNQRAENQEPQP